MASNQLFEMMGNIEVKIDDAVSSMDKVTDKAEQASNGIVDKFKTGAKLLGAVFAVDKIIDFGKLAVQAAADAQALQAQFEQVFGNMQGKATEMIDGMASEFGMLPERLTPVFTQLTSKFKGLGVDSEEAMAMAEKATTQAADAAAYFDISMEDATSALNSYLNGSTEAGEKIGLYANQTQLASWAVSQGLIAQTSDWAKLEDAQKSAMVLDYIDYTYELNGAMGQAAKESDGLENVMGNLKAAWQKFLAVVGGPILKAVIPIITGITNGVVFLADSLGPVMEGIKAWIEPITNVKGLFSGMFDSANSASSGLISTFGEVQTAIGALFDILMGNMTNSEGTDLMEQLGMSDGAIALVLQAVDTIRGALDGLSVAWDAMKSAGEWAWNSIVSVAQLAIDFYATYLMGIFEGILEWWTNNQESISNIVSMAWGLITSVLTTAFTFIQDLFYAVWEPLSTWFNENQALIQQTVSTVWNGILTIITWIMENIVTNIVTGWNNIMIFLQPILDLIVQVVSITMNLILGIITAIMQLINGDWSGAWQTIKETVSTFMNEAKTTLTTILTNMLTAVIQKATDMYNSIKEWFGKIPGKITELWGQAQSFLEGINLWAIGESIVQGLWNGIKAKWDSMVAWVSDAASNIGDTLKSVLNINSPSKVMIPIGSAVPEGVAVGVEKGWSFVDKALNKVGTKIADTSFSIPDVAMASDYTFKHVQQPTQAQQNRNSLLEEAVYLLRKIFDKDTNININGRTLSEEILDDINYLNDLYSNRNTRIIGGVAYP